MGGEPDSDSYKGRGPLRHHFIPLSAVQWQVEKSGKEAPVCLSMNEIEAKITQDPGMHLLVYCHLTQTTVSKFVQGCGSNRDVVPKNPSSPPKQWKVLMASPQSPRATNKLCNMKHVLFSFFLEETTEYLLIWLKDNKWENCTVKAGP